MNKRFVWIHGISGMGKTIYAQLMASARIRSPGGRLAVVDPNGVFNGFGDVVSVAEAPRRIARAGPGGFAIVIRPAWGEKLSDVWRHLFAAGRVLVIADEAQKYASKENLDPNFLFLVETGRNRQVDLCTTSQAPTTLDPRIRSNWDVTVHFRQSNPSYADRIAAEYFHQPAYADLLRKLERGAYIRATADGAAPTMGRVPIPPPPPPLAVAR